MLTYKHNASARPPINPKNPPAAINCKDFRQLYYPYLLNDIALPPRLFSMSKGDAGECNSANLHPHRGRRRRLLGNAWLASELHRFKAVPPNGVILP